MSHSTALLEIRNIRALVDQHKAQCHDPECGVSTMFAKWTAERALPAVTDPREADDAAEILKGWPV